MSKPDKVEVLIQNEQVKRERMAYVWELVGKGLPAGPVLVTLGREVRSPDQNAKMWPMLNDVSTQVDWYGHKPTTWEWKDIFSAALYKQKTYPGIDGGFVVCGQKTSKLTKRPFAELIELMYAFGAEHSVQWSEKSEALATEYAQYLSKERAKDG